MIGCVSMWYVVGNEALIANVRDWMCLGAIPDTLRTVRPCAPVAALTFARINAFNTILFHPKRAFILSWVIGVRARFACILFVVVIHHILRYFALFSSRLWIQVSALTVRARGVWCVILVNLGARFAFTFEQFAVRRPSARAARYRGALFATSARQIAIEFVFLITIIEEVALCRHTLHVLGAVVVFPKSCTSTSTPMRYVDGADKRSSSGCCFAAVALVIVIFAALYSRVYCFVGFLVTLAPFSAAPFVALCRDARGGRGGHRPEH
jgi:hypothetical protein